MPDPDDGGIRILLDQNIPRAIADWLRELRPEWVVSHTSEIGLDRKTDQEIFEFAQSQNYIIVTFDEDFADQRSFPVGLHSGVIRLRIWPTTNEETQSALTRLLQEVSDEELRGTLVIIDRQRIRIRSSRSR